MTLDTLAKINERKTYTQSQLAENLRVSVGTINKDIKELQKKGLLNKEGQLTKSGNQELENTKIQNAIILAAGWGSRMTPVTDNCPKPLVKLHGKPMIETTIETLQRRGIKDITIVVGKLREKFDYLIEKYNVELVYNKDWNKKDTVASIATVAHKLSNTIIIEGDSPIWNDKIILKHVQDSLWMGSYHEGPTAEWTYKTRGKNIVGIEAGGENNFIWKGIWYINRELSEVYKKFLPMAMKNPKYNNLDHAYMSLDLIKDINKNIRLYKIQKDDITEIDTYEELCAKDSSYLNWDGAQHD
ncbi:MAG: NTP transferase domain-containing protein [Mycoplasmatales bacterium]|nr:NTP transferase domain-containing protein [Mycoplasmatales bacterium]